MDNQLILESYDTTPLYWKNFIKYVELKSDPEEWRWSEGGEGSYTYNMIARTLITDYNCKIDYTVKGGIIILFPSEHHKLLFSLKYA